MRGVCFGSGIQYFHPNIAIVKLDPGSILSESIARNKDLVSPAISSWTPILSCFYSFYLWWTLFFIFYYFYLWWTFHIFFICGGPLFFHFVIIFICGGPLFFQFLFFHPELSPRYPNCTFLVDRLLFRAMSESLWVSRPNINSGWKTHKWEKFEQPACNLREISWKRIILLFLNREEKYSIWC